MSKTQKGMKSSEDSISKIQKNLIKFQDAVNGIKEELTKLARRSQNNMMTASQVVAANEDHKKSN